MSTAKLHSGILYATFILIFFSMPSIINAQNKGIDFKEIPDWKGVLKRAKIENKNIFVDAFTTWCGPCKLMDSNVYPDSIVGQIVNNDFISVKLQMDTTNNDNDHVKSWYNAAHEIGLEAHIFAYPSFLFYNSEGKLIYKTIGYKSSEEFIKIVKFAIDPQREAFKNDLVDYQNGIKHFSKMPALAQTARELLGDRNLALAIAKDYKENYLDKLNAADFKKRENIVFIHENGNAMLVNTKDKMFNICYFNSSYVDSILGPGIARQYVNSVITNLVINPHLFKNEKAIIRSPNWKYIQTLIASKYPRVDEKGLILDSKIAFYKKIGDWRSYTLYKSEQIKFNPPKAIGTDVFFALNVPAWDAFQHCEDKQSLERALYWSTLSIELEMAENPSGALIQYFDTKANLLYKLGRVEEAIAIEMKAINMDEKYVKTSVEFRDNVEKMRRGIPTW